LAVRAGPAGPSLMFARYRRAVEKLRALADSCESVRNWPPEDRFLLEAYLFRVVLEPAGQPGLPAVSRRGLRWPAEPGRRPGRGCKREGFQISAAGGVVTAFVPGSRSPVVPCSQPGR
jgi:hypothetical protein